MTLKSFTKQELIDLLYFQIRLRNQITTDIKILMESIRSRSTLAANILQDKLDSNITLYYGYVCKFESGLTDQEAHAKLPKKHPDKILRYTIKFRRSEKGTTVDVQASATSIVYMNINTFVIFGYSSKTRTHYICFNLTENFIDLIRGEELRHLAELTQDLKYCRITITNLLKMLYIFLLNEQCEFVEIRSGDFRYDNLMAPVSTVFFPDSTIKAILQQKSCTSQGYFDAELLHILSDADHNNPNLWRIIEGRFEDIA